MTTSRATGEGSLRILFVLPGFHRVERGAEVALEAVAAEIARAGRDIVTVVGGGPGRADDPYKYVHARTIDREHFEKWPRVPVLFDTEYTYEDLSFAAAARLRVNFHEQDVTVTCSYPYSSWMSRLHLPGRKRPAHVFVTQNGDWPAYSPQRRYALFSCDGLVCTNPEYYERNKVRWRCELIPNGFDPERFEPGPGTREDFGIPVGVPVVLMASALVSSKRVLDGIRAVAPLEDVVLVVAGDGPQRDDVDSLSDALMPGRFIRMSVARHRMADLYRSADVFLHMSTTESFGNVYVEALACGRPIVAHASPTTKWIFNGNDRGVSLIDTEDLEAVRTAIRQRCRDSVSAGDRAVIEAEFGWPSIAQRYRAFLAEVVDARRAEGDGRLRLVARRG